MSCHVRPLQSIVSSAVLTQTINHRAIPPNRSCHQHNSNKSNHRAIRCFVLCCASAAVLTSASAASAAARARRRARSSLPHVCRVSQKNRIESESRHRRQGQQQQRSHTIGAPKHPSSLEGGYDPTSASTTSSPEQRSKTLQRAPSKKITKQQNPPHKATQQCPSHSPTHRCCLLPPSSPPLPLQSTQHCPSHPLTHRCCVLASSALALAPCLPPPSGESVSGPWAWASTPTYFSVLG